MSKVRVESFTISLDGFGAGIEQAMENPMGIGGHTLHQWAMPTKTFQKVLFGSDHGTTGIDEKFAIRGFDNIGAWILGRNMFGPVRGQWPDMTWKGWWGENPPYHVPVFVLTHYPRPPLVMEGGTVFHFITGGIHEALILARQAAGEKDVRVGGGVQVIQQYLQARLIDEMHIAISHVFLGRGEHLFSNVNLLELGYQCTECVSSEKATHLIIQRQNQ